MKKDNSSLFLFFLTLIFISLLCIAYYFSNQFFDKKFNDYFIRQTLSQDASSKIALIVIDDKSLKELRWPWPRSLYNDIFDYFQSYSKVKAIAFDAVISSSDIENKGADDEFFSALKRFDKLAAGFDLYSTKSNQVIVDKRLEQAFEKKFQDFNIIDGRTKKVTSQYNSLVTMPMAYLASINKLGSVIIPIEDDGIIRGTLPIVEYNGKLYPSLSLQVYSIMTGNKDYYLSDTHLCSLNDRCTSLKVPITQIEEPTAGIYASINWLKPKNRYYSHYTYSAIDILNSYKALKQGKQPLIPPEVFDNLVVVVGGNANIQSLADRRVTPILSQHAGIDIQATVLDNMLTNRFLYYVPQYINLILTFVIAFLTFILIRKTKTMTSVSFTAIILTIFYYLYYFGVTKGIIYSFLPICIIEVIVLAFGFSYKFLVEGNRKNEKIERAMGMYISKDVMRNVVRDIDKLKLGGKRANVTVMFADIRGFTSISEKMTAEDVSNILNEYFCEIEPIIMKYNGIINKFIGDAVMVIFGEPIQDNKHPMNAVLCANAMLKKVKQLQAKWLGEGKPKLEIGIGINTGEVFVGNIGTQERIEYTVIGDTVNIASRIESFNKIYKTRFLISQETYGYVSDISDVIKIREVTIRGKAKKINIYEVLRIIND